MPSVNLTDAELALLDGKCSEKAQRAVDAAKARLVMAESLGDLDEKLAGFIADVKLEAIKAGKLIFRRKSIRCCNVCGETAGYGTYKRNSRWHRKGDTNWKVPLSLSGVELADRCITIRGHATLGCCSGCFNKLKSHLIEILSNVRSEIPESLMGEKPKYRRVQLAKCKKCDWQGRESEMGRSPTLIGGGSYPSDCPSKECDAKNGVFGPREIEFLTDQYEVIPVVRRA